jgi:hypothetical protein
VTTSAFLCALLATGLAIGLSREHRIRRAFQNLAARLLAQLRGETRPHYPTPRRRNP